MNSGADMREGVLYIAYGDRHLAEAARSAASVHRHHPGMPMIVFTSEDDLRTRGDWLRATFGSVAIHPEIQGTFRDKIGPLLHSPFEKTLYLDADTEMLWPVPDLFEILDRFPFAYSRDSIRYAMPAKMVPAIFSEPNGGVLAFRRCPEVEALLRRWLALYDECESDWEKAKGTRRGFTDQGPLRIALHESDVRQYIFGAEYNLRAYALWFAGARVRILHAREPFLSRWRNRINRSEDMRYGDGARWHERSLFYFKQWIKKRFFGKAYAWENKESVNKQYDGIGPE